MKEEKEVKISFWAAHITTIISVTLLLLIVGVIALVSLSAHRETQRLKEKIEVSIVLADSVSDAQTSALFKNIAARPYALNAKIITKQQALQAWKADTGEDLESIFGVNPLSPEIAFTLKSEFSNKETLTTIQKELHQLPEVEEVALPDSSLVEAMNENIESLSIILGCIGIVLIIISFVLINNTVHLTVYSRRFTIHTMQLVGATNGFIRRPVVINNMMAGVIAAVLAISVLAVCVFALPDTSSINISDYVTWQEFACVGGILVVLGGLLCALAAFISTSRFLRKDYEELFR